MNAELAAALEKSIQHWVENSMAENCDEADDSPGACALCQYSFTKTAGTNRNHCSECPIYARTKSPSCIDTPYGEASEALDRWARNPESEEFKFAYRNAALEEVEFLKSLRE